ncbi:glycoside hydrolase family 15 protein [Streptomyces sp. WMMC500]|uniref:glycoside hydrolase family 15 protein n=1 Tax=Streptomyces sp. WMMC500 TaxID=3015154 RepID=UPI00248BA2DF|nr:glycoside hydrolase family 15 protein [Streptomyces sp. WMMC500]WBB63939.1 glycoside hydrolase family 15 protein [Streptomyces sp. WMMC500]
MTPGPYPPIADHGIIGDLQTVALVSAEGVVDWLCSPRFDSPSVFGALLDHERGGRFGVTADASDAVTRQIYLPGTAVLVTRFLSTEGIGEVLDFMPVDHPEQATDRHRVIRLVRALRGRMRFTLDCSPRFDYGRDPHRLEVDGRTARFRSATGDGHLQLLGPVHGLTRDGEDVRAVLDLAPGRPAAAVFTLSAPGAEPPPAAYEQGVHRELDAVRSYWHRWTSRCTYRGRWREVVTRSAITLKLLMYAPTGAPVAAATMGLPEQIGGERNWDYRYTWIRDASLSVRALLDLGYAAEADAYRLWLGERLVAGHEGARAEAAGGGTPGNVRRGTVTGEPLQVMYRVDGDPHLPEETLPHWEGYRGSAPVRAGNAAADQLQLDIYGEAVYALAQASDTAGHAGYDSWRYLAALLDWLSDHWDRPDEGIWETRGGRQDFTYSRLMCWVAFERGVRMAADLARPGDVARWTAARDAIFEQVMERGYSTRRQAFVQHYGSEVLDASLLLMPRVGFAAAREPRWLSTLRAMEAELVTDSLVHRYDPSAAPDGLRGSEGTFSLCSFLYVSALAGAGHVDRARYAFEKMLTYANHVGLFAEEIGPTGEQLGNFPQAFTHLALIMAALTLDEALDAAESEGGTAPHG